MKLHVAADFPGAEPRFAQGGFLSGVSWGGTPGGILGGNPRGTWTVTIIASVLRKGQ